MYLIQKRKYEKEDALNKPKLNMPLSNKLSHE
jgi:hypothetical protein